MTRRLIQEMTNAELVELFMTSSIAKGRAVLGGENAKASRLYWKIDAIEKELKVRPGDQRRLLAPLFEHRDPYVRLQSATSTLAIFPDQSRRILQTICDRQEFPFAGEAGMRLSALESGFFKPT